MGMTSCYSLNAGAATSSITTVFGTYIILEEIRTTTPMHRTLTALGRGLRRVAPDHWEVLLLHDHRLPLDSHQVHGLQIHHLWIHTLMELFHPEICVALKDLTSHKSRMLSWVITY